MRKKRILILGGAGGWLDDFCYRPDFEFKKETSFRPTSWHERGATAPLSEWLGHVKNAYAAMSWQADCVIALFPQRALAAAALLRLKMPKNTRLVAWHFNLGSVSNRWKGRVAGSILRRVDKFIVHARGEIDSYARWLNIDRDKFHFVPLQKGKIGRLELSPVQKPYIVSMGSANRDYMSLANAVLGTGIKTVIISKKGIIESLPDHPDLVKMHNLTEDECNAILGGAAINVVPIGSSETASGQVTLTTSMRMGVPTIATRCIGTIDYIQDGETGLLVPPHDSAALRRAIIAIWRDDAVRLRVGSAGYQYAEKYFSDEAAGQNLTEVIDEILTTPTVQR